MGWDGWNSWWWGWEPQGLCWEELQGLWGPTDMWGPTDIWWPTDIWGPADMWGPPGLWEPADMCGRWELPAGWCKHASTSSSILREGKILVLKCHQWISLLCFHFPPHSTGQWPLLHKSQNHVEFQFRDLWTGITLKLVGQTGGGASGKSFGRKFKRRGCSPS